MAISKAFELWEQEVKNQGRQEGRQEGRQSRDIEIGLNLLREKIPLETTLRTELSRYDAIGSEVFKVGMGLNQGWVQVCFPLLGMNEQSVAAITSAVEPTASSIV